MKTIPKTLSTLFFIALLFLVAVLVSNAWTNPSAAPPGGGGGITVDSSGRVGIGASSPLSKLAVGGGVSIGSGYAGLAAPTNGLIVEGNLGIGVPSPTNKLEVANSSLKIGSGSPFTGIFLNSSGNFGIGTLTPGARLVVEGGNAYISTQTKGLILRATTGTNCYRLTVDSAGMLVSTLLTCP